MLRNAVLLCILGVSLSACASIPSSPALTSVTAAVPLPKGFVHYAVRPGETLWHIARCRHIELEELIRLNRIADVHRIAAGQQLVVPALKETLPETNFTSASTGGLDFFWPVEGKVVAYFRDKDHGVANKGIDILAPPGTKICAARSGRVTFIGKLPGYGTTIVLDHGDGFASVYCGAKDTTVQVEENVPQGLVLALAGNRIRHEDGRIHFEIRHRHKPQNPLFFLD